MFWLIGPLVSSAVTLCGLFILFRKFKHDLELESNDLLEQVQEKFLDPVVKRSMGIAGKMGGDVKAVGAIKKRMSKAFIDKHYGMLKIAADKILGINVDDLIDEYGAENILTAVSELGPRLGFDASQMMQDLGTPKNLLMNKNPKMSKGSRDNFYG